jgi:hypothetical protein
MLKGIFHGAFESQLATQRPKQNRSQHLLLKQPSQILLLEPRIDFSALLSNGKDRSQAAAASRHVFVHENTYPLACQEGGDESSGKIGAATRFFCQTLE